MNNTTDISNINISMKETEDNFDADAYLNIYPEIANEYDKDNVWSHYIIYGKLENRIFPNKSIIQLIDSDMYCLLYPDVEKKYNKDLAWLHYVKHGIKENRIFANKLIIDNFDYNAYCNMYPDVLKTYSKPLSWVHYLKHGRKEARTLYINNVNSEPFMDRIMKTIVKKEQQLHFKSSPKKLINILIRTCYRPLLFKRCINSILSQNYSNFNIIICYDNKDAIEYIKPYINTNVSGFYIDIKNNNNKYKFNLYCNHLINKVKNGFCIYLDDDNEFTHNNCLNIINHYITCAKITIWKYLRGDKLIYPLNINNINIGDIDSSCLCIHHSYKTYGKWPDKRCGDYYFLESILKTITNKNKTTNKDEILFIPYILTKCIQYKIGNFGKAIIMDE